MIINLNSNWLLKVIIMDRRKTVQRTIILETINQFITQLLMISTNKSRNYPQIGRPPFIWTLTYWLRMTIKKDFHGEKKQSMIGI